MQEVTLDTARATMAAIVAEKPEGYRYEKPNGWCVYVHDGAPSCGVGHALAAWGFDLAQLQASGDDLHYSGVGKNGQSIRTVVGSFGLPVSDDALSYLGEFQFSQDSNYTWADALATAEDVVAGRRQGYLEA